LHDATVQLPDVQAGVPFATAHAMPQAPQFEALLVVLTSQPSAYVPLQFA
jgi:hypothetical protein